MLQVIERCFTARRGTGQWNERLGTMIPSYGDSIIDDPVLASKIRHWTHSTLRLKKHSLFGVQVDSPKTNLDIDELVA
jgi:malate dehydrogenase (quinone)